MRSCFDGPLTPKCIKCEHWKNEIDSHGCHSPFPIMECEAFAEVEEIDKMIEYITQYPKICGWRKEELMRMNPKEVRSIYRNVKKAVHDNLRDFRHRHYY